MKVFVAALMAAASMATAQSTVSAPPVTDSEAPTTSADSATAAPAGKHRLGGGFRGLPVSTPASTGTPAPKPPAASTRSPAPRKSVRIDNDTIGGGVASSRSGHVASAGSGPPPPTPATAIPADSGVRDLEGHDESYWRGRARAAEDRVVKAREAVVSVEAEEHKLENDFYAWDDGQYRDRVIKPEWDKAKQALVDARAEVVASQAALDDLSEEARKAGALPGWLR